jgi:hypothetical protein
MATTPLWTYRGVEAELDLTGYEVEARDGSVGTVEAATRKAGAGYLVVDTGTWIFGRTVLLPAGLVDRVDPGSRRIFLNRSRDEIKNAPEYDQAGPTETHRAQVGMYYGALVESAPAPRAARTRQTSSGRRTGGGSRSSSRRSSTRSSSSSSRRRSRARQSNDGPTRDELYEQAKRLGIEGRSKMNKAQLARAVGRKRGGSSSSQSRRSTSSSRGRKANPVEVQKFLDGVSYPTRRGDLIREAERKGASQKVRSTLERLPDRRFKDPTEVSEAVGKAR